MICALYNNLRKIIIIYSFSVFQIMYGSALFDYNCTFMYCYWCLYKDKLSRLWNYNLVMTHGSVAIWCLLWMGQRPRTISLQNSAAYKQPERDKAVCRAKCTCIYYKKIFFIPRINKNANFMILFPLIWGKKIVFKVIVLIGARFPCDLHVPPRCTNISKEPIKQSSNVMYLSC